MGINTLPVVVVAPPALQEQIFTSSGTWTAPTGVTKAWVQIIGAGGGGGNSSGSVGGGGGQPGTNYTSQFTVTPATGYTVVIGAGGAAQSTGGSSSFGGTTAVGGSSGANISSSNPPQYGFNCYGTGGSPGPQNGAGTTATNGGYGAGGGGQGVNGTSGGNCQGGPGIVIVRWLA